MFVMQAAISKAGRTMGVDPAEIQRKNLLSAGDVLPYGMKLGTPTLRRCWEEVEQRASVSEARKAVAAFNASHRLEKKGLALMPVCFGISFTATQLNQASALVHVHSDGSVSLSTAAVEMGQGTNAKMRQVAAATFSIGLDRVRVESTNTSRIANTSPTAASSGPDLNGHATRLACLNILGGLKELAAKRLNAQAEEIEIENERIRLCGQETSLGWSELVSAAYLARVNLSAHVHYATPDIHFNRESNKGEPFTYHAVGVACVEATVDCLRGTAKVDRVHIVHDAGQSLNTLVDRGQVEGGLMQGIGWMTMEEIAHDATGRLLTDTLTTYKLPDLHSTPDEVIVHFLENSTGPAGILGAKTVGEPPFMYGIGAFYAIVDALRAGRPELDPKFVAPLTAERIFSLLNSSHRACSPASSKQV
jgi:xanthine dehydrogenase large subunit